MNAKAAKKKYTKNVLAGSRAQRGLDREAHFAAGGTTAMWRGIHTVTKNGRRDANRKACRGRVQD